MKAKSSVTVRVECVQCRSQKDIGPGDVEPGSVPFCDKCYMPMVAVSAKAKLR
jgi:hypothetical protein